MLAQLLKVAGPQAVKQLLYGKRGEPHAIGRHQLRFTPGTRPTRLSYATSKDDWVSRYDALQQIYLAEHLKPGHRAIDVGAEFGQESLMMAALCGSEGQVWAFEPNRDARAGFERNVALNPGVKPPELVPAACSDTDGLATLFTEDGNSANSSLSSAAYGATDGYEVETVRLDTWAAGRGVDLVKIDVEGYEIRVLEGAEAILASNAIVLCELHPYAWPALGDSYEKLRELAARHGRRVRYLDQDSEPADIPLTSMGYGVAVLER